MSTSRNALKTRQWHDALRQAFNSGQYRKAASIFEEHEGGSEPIDIVLVAASSRMRTDPAEVLRRLVGLKVPTSNIRLSIERESLLAEAHARTGAFDAADENLQRAVHAALQLGDPEVIAALGYRAVRRYLLEERPANARASLELAQRGVSRRAAIYAAYCETLILPYEERVFEQANKLIEVLRSIDPAGTDFTEIRVWGTHTLAALARELYLPAAIPEVERQLDGVPLPEDFAHNVFQAYRALAWAKALQGDYFNAFRNLKKATSTSDTIAWKVVAACDRAYLAGCFDEHCWSRVELDEAEALADTVDWHSTLGEERIGLLQLAELFGKIDSGRSAMYLARYRELGELRSPLYNRHDARRSAYAQYAAGSVELALGNRKRALTELRAARTVFERFGFDARAARCLLDEFAITRNRALLPSIRERLLHYRESWLWREYQKVSGPAETLLPPMQQRVFEELCEGKSTAEIAHTLSRSEFTISNHIKQIFKAFGVKTRQSLLVEAVRRGMAPTMR